MKRSAPRISASVKVTPSKKIVVSNKQSIGNVTKTSVKTFTPKK